MKKIFALYVFVFACQKQPPSNLKLQTASLNNISNHQTEIEELDTIKLVVGQIDYSKLKSFVAVKGNKFIKITNNKLYSKHLDSTTFEQFKLMQKAFYDSLKKKKIKHFDMIIVSAVRSFKHQKTIWEDKWTGNKGNYYLNKNETKRALEILKYSSMPMTSRHHWGTDIDINKIESAYFSKTEGKILYDWLTKNARNFGFYQIYSNKKLNSRTGYEEEKWHWSYLPKAKKYLAFYNKNISDKYIAGFKGSDQAEKIQMVKSYVNGITSE